MTRACAVAPTPAWYPIPAETRPDPDLDPAWRAACLAADELLSAVQRIGSDVVFRRQLRYHPAKALARLGFETERLPATLPVRHYAVSSDPSRSALLGTPPVFRAVADVGRTSSPDVDPHHDLQIRLVRYGLKPLALAHCSSAEAELLAAAARRQGLAALLSPYVFDPVPDPVSGYINIAGARRAASDSDPGSWRGILLASDWNQVELGWLSLLYCWDELLGYLLGYPTCCVRSYAALWSEACRAHDGEVARVLLARTADNPVRARHPCMNLFARYFGFALTEHFPCSFSCAATATQGEQLAVDLMSYEPAHAAELIDALASPVLVHPDHGIVLFRGARWRDDERFGFETALATAPRSATVQRLVQAGEASVHEPGRWWTPCSRTT